MSDNRSDQAVLFSKGVMEEIALDDDLCESTEFDITFLKSNSRKLVKTTNRMAANGNETSDFRPDGDLGQVNAFDGISMMPSTYDSINNDGDQPEGQ